MSDNECSHGRYGWCPLCTISELRRELAAAQAECEKLREEKRVILAESVLTGDERDAARKELGEAEEEYATLETERNRINRELAAARARLREACELYSASMTVQLTRDAADTERRVFLSSSWYGKAARAAGGGE